MKMTMSNKQKSEQDILKEITSGKYADCYLVYNRKSTDEADNQKNSIAYLVQPRVEHSLPIYQGRTVGQ